MEIIEKILLELYHRVKDGMPNLKNPTHLLELRNTMQKLNKQEDAIDLLFLNLTEGVKPHKDSKLVKDLGASNNISDEQINDIISGNYTDDTLSGAGATYDTSKNTYSLSDLKKEE